MSLNDHYDAVVARLQHGILSGNVFDVVRASEDGTPVRANYVVVGMDLPTPNDQRYTAPQVGDSDAPYRWDVRTVATTRSAVLRFAQAVRDRLLNHTLVVPGRSCDPIRLVDAVEEGRVMWDRTARLFYADETYEAISRRANQPA